MIDFLKLALSVENYIPNVFVIEFNHHIKIVNEVVYLVYIIYKIFKPLRIMKYLFLFIGICLSLELFSQQQVVIFSKTERCYLDLKNAPCNPEGKDKTDFINLFRKESFSDTSKLNKARLFSPPLQWGRNIRDTNFGEIFYPSSFQHGFITDLSLVNLLPDHEYELCMNGNPKLAGNDLLPDAVPNMQTEKYYDFLPVKTDHNGEYHARLGVYLIPGDYHVRLYVKDRENFQIVLYHDYFKFTAR